MWLESVHKILVNDTYVRMGKVESDRHKYGKVAMPLVVLVPARQESNLHGQIARSRVGSGKTSRTFMASYDMSWDGLARVVARSWPHINGTGRNWPLIKKENSKSVCLDATGFVQR